MLRKLGVEPGETRVFLLGAATLLTIGWTDVSLKMAGEALFIKRGEGSGTPLALAYLINMVLLVVTTSAVGRAFIGRDPLSLLPRVLGGLALALLPLWALLASGLDAALWPAIWASKQVTSIALLAFWLAMGELLSGRQAKRLFAPLMAGVTLGAIIGSWASRPISARIGVEATVLVSSVVLVAGILPALPLRRLRPALFERFGADGSRQADDSEAEAVGLGSLWTQSWLFRLLLLTAACGGLLAPMLYMQFQHVADVATGGGSGESTEQSLFDFYSLFHRWVYGGVLIAQLTLTSRLYRRLGVPLSAALSPFFYFAGFLGLSIRGVSVPVGVGAKAGTELQDSAVYDPAQRVLFNLFPERLRARATALLEGPVKRAGGVVGLGLCLLALSTGGVVWIGYLALPISALWMVVAVVLWRRYPALLLQASAGRDALEEPLAVAELLDPATVRALGPELSSEDPGRCATAIDLVAEARPELAVGALAAAAREAPAATRSLLVAALDRVLEDSITNPVFDADAARHVEALLAEPDRLSERDRADVVQAYGRLTDGDVDTSEAREVLERALADPAAAVRLAASVALYRRGTPTSTGVGLDEALEAAATGDDDPARRTAREEYRAILLCTQPSPAWEGRLAVLARLLALESERVETAEGIADVAARHGVRANVVADAMLSLCEASDPRLRAALLRFSGHAGLESQASWMVQQLGSPDRSEVAAAREGLCALGPGAAEALIVELTYGRRSVRDIVLSVVRELDVEHDALGRLYDREVDALRRTLVHLHALTGHTKLALLRQRLQERLEEGMHTALLFLSVIHDEDQIAEVGQRLRHERGGRQQAILLETLEAFLGPREKAQLVPLIEDRDLEFRGRAAAAALGVPIPSVLEAGNALREDTDELTRVLSRGLLPARRDTQAGLAGLAGLATARTVEDDGAVLRPVEIALLLKGLPIFERLTTRQLMDLASTVSEERHPPGVTVVREGDFDQCIYLIVDGTVEILKGETFLQDMGPKSFFGELAVFEGIARSASVVTKTDTHLLRLGRVDLLRLMEEMPAIAISVCQTLSRRVRELTERLNP